MDFLEKDMYKPVASFLKAQGYTVKGEVKDCDIIACKEQLTVAVELKRAFNLKLVYQAVDRKDFADIVYVAIPRTKKSANSKSEKNMLKLLKCLDIGLITVAMDSPFKPVQEVLSPEKVKSVKNKRKRKAIDKEFNERELETSKGGVYKEKILTAYREKCIELLCIIEQREIVSNKELKEMGYDTKMASMLYKNFYGWFEKVKKATYGLSKKGIEALDEDEFKTAIDYYREKASKGE